MKPIANKTNYQEQECCSQILPNFSETQQSGCCPPSKQNKTEPSLYTLKLLKDSQKSEPMLEACCGSAPGPAANSWEQPGYKLYSFVSGFVFTPRGWIPQIATHIST